MPGLFNRLQSQRAFLDHRVSAMEQRLNNSDERMRVIRYALDRIDQLVQACDKETPRKSYSQQSEDLLVDTLYSSVLQRFQPGFYLDIGAAHPINLSNTYFFYKLGWTGICVEPNPAFHALYKQHRPHDVALNFGLSSKSEILTYHQFEFPYINGFYGQENIDWQVKTNGQTYLGGIEIACLNVNDFLRQHVQRPVDFLNIDVESLDIEILTTWDWGLCRPLIICAEIIATDLHDIIAHNITKILGRQGYTPVSRAWHSTIFVQADLLQKSKLAGQDEIYGKADPR